MSNIFTMFTGGKDNSAQRICRVAYTLNNAQPVQCTIIGDQPLFYMDYDIDYEDEDMAMFDDADLQILERELCTLKKEIDSLDHFSQGFSEDPYQRLEEFAEDRDLITGIRDVQPSLDINLMLETLNKSRIAAAYIEFAKDHNIEIKFSAEIMDAEYDRNVGTILINQNLDLTDQVLLCARELRRHWQHRQGALINPMLFQPDNAVLINRVQVADLSVSMVRIAWELQLSGAKEAWERIENSSLSDLGHALAREAFLDFRTLNNGEAMASLFEAWFLSERCRMEDKKLIQRMLADYGGYVFNTETAEESITPTLIAALGEMPFGKNYLAQHAMTIMDDPIFTEVRDRSNANFLWFIKFERSFRETEQELQFDFEPAAGDIRSSGAQHNTQDQNHGQKGHTADIISLFTDGEQVSEAPDSAGDKVEQSAKLLKPKDRSKRKNNKGSAEIIYLRRWSSE